MDDKLKGQVMTTVAAVVAVLTTLLGVRIAGPESSSEASPVGPIVVGVLGALTLMVALYLALLWVKAKSWIFKDNLIDAAMKTLLRTIVAGFLLICLAAAAAGLTQIVPVFSDEPVASAAVASHDFPRCVLVLLDAPVNSSGSYRYIIQCDAPLPLAPAAHADASAAEAPRVRRWASELPHLLT